MIAPAPIRALPPAVADAIAAGEVVERPASVIKELCENALDAGAGRIDVGIEDAGTVRLRVSDDGAGIEAAQLPLAVARHATSKISAATDLESVATLGFRGEALASIAAVADMVITTRTRSAAAAAVLRVRGSEIVERASAAAAPGTTVEVRDLFATTPARLRFLRSARSETAAAVRVVSDLALTHAHVAFTCRVDGRVALRSSGEGRGEALRAVFGAQAAELRELEAPGDVGVSGAISEPRAHRGTSASMVLVVNGRRIHNRLLLVAVEEAYRGLLPGGRHPFGLVAVSLDPASVDVNVHPTKREVRFREEGRVFAAVQRACWAALGSARPYVAAAPLLQLGVSEGAPSLTLRGLAAGRMHTAGGRGVAAHDTASGLAPVAPPGTAGAFGPALVAAAGDGADADADGIASLRPLRALGQSGSAWLVAESPRGVVLVDPHAAHEKVIYAELMERWRSAGAPRESDGRSQLLLLPAVVDCDPDHLALLDVHAELIARSGFALEPFGPALLRCTAVPATHRGGEAGTLVRDLLDALGDGDRPPSEREHRVAALVACHSAVRLGEPMAGEEQQRLLDRLLVTPGAMTCPHGRPTVLVLDDEALRRAFRRPV